MIPQKRGPDRDFRFFLWGVIFVIALLTICLLAADKAASMRQTKPSPLHPDWNAIAAFYAGRPISSIKYDWTNTMGTTGFPESGYIRLNPQVQTSLEALAKYGPRSQRGMVAGALGLSVLIHESLHNRANSQGFDNSNEIMEGDLGWRLIPDAIQRFFGVKMDSPWGKKWTDMVLKTLAPVK